MSPRNLASAALGVLVIASFMFAAIAFDRSQQTNVKDRRTLCQAQNSSNSALRGVLTLARSLSRNPSPAAEAFYSEAIAKVPRLDCSNLSQ